MSERVPDPPSPYAGYVSYSDYARLAARVAELEGEVAKLRKCVRAADSMREEICCEHDNGRDPREKCCDACWTMIAYDAARAEVDKP